MFERLKSRRLDPTSVRRILKSAVFGAPVAEPLEGRTLFAAFVVNSTGDLADPDPNITTLREAFDAADLNNQADTITFDPTLFSVPRTINLTAGQLNRDTDFANMTITGPGAKLLTVNGNFSNQRLFGVYSRSLDLSGMTLTGGMGDVGGALRNSGGTLNVTDVVISNNNAKREGGGVYNQNGGTTTLTRTTISGNSAPEFGGGVVNRGGQVTLVNSTVSGNSVTDADSVGGGVGSSPFPATTTASLTITNTTITENSASAGAGGGLSVRNTSVALNNTIVSGNFAPNLTNVRSVSATTTGSNNFIDGDAKLGPLQDNGGPTPTRAPLPGSPVVNAGSNAAATGLDTDQRGAGYARVIGPAVDIGAVEVQNPAPTVSTPIPDVTVSEDAPPITVNLNSYFVDNEDATNQLKYTVTGNSNTALFSNVAVDDSTGVLTLTLAPDAAGIADITIRATDAQGQSVEDTFRVTVTPVADVSIGDVTLIEGDSGTTAFVFPVTRDSSVGTTTVDFATERGSANDVDDYTAALGSVAFADGETEKTITVFAKGDRNYEPDQNFFVRLTNPNNGTIADGEAIGTILNDDARVQVTVNDVAVSEGKAGATTNLTFTVKLSAGSHPKTTVKFTTVGNTATSGTDFIAKSGTLTFDTFETSKKVTIQVKGDGTVEPDETFRLVLSNVTGGGAAITDGTGVGTILNDDRLPQMTINSVTVDEGTGGSGFTSMKFTVELDKAAASPVTVHYATANGTATAGSDYNAKSGTLTFLAGELFKTVTIQVRKDATKEASESLFVNLSDIVGPAQLADDTGKGTIRNDD